MTTPAGDPTNWFQIAGTLAVTVLGGAWAWMQMQMKWLRQDAEQSEQRAVVAVNALREEFEKRHADHVRQQERQHEDNRAEMAAIRSSIHANADVARAENRRVMDSLEKANDQLMLLVADHKR